MEHTTTVLAALDVIQPSGVLYAVATDSQRQAVKAASRAYMLARSTGDYYTVAEANDAVWRVISKIGA